MSGTTVAPGHLPGELTPVPTPRGEFSLRSMDPVHDFDLVLRWMNDPVVSQFWDLDGSPGRLQAHVDQQFAGTHSRPYVGLLDDEPMSYWELYWASEDRLAGYYPAQAGDAGVHVLVGPGRLRGSGLGGHLVRAVSDWQLAHPRAEPDTTNAASRRAFERAGFVYAGEVALPEKTAALMIRTPTPGAPR